MPTTAILSFDVDAESAILATGRRYAEHAMVMTHQAFGPRVGVPRILRLLADYDLPGTFFIPGLTAERYPETVASVLEAGHEVAHHSWSHRSAIDLSADEERADFERALAVLRSQGVDVKGHRAAMWEASWQTPNLIAEHGLIYDSSLMDADSPYLLETDKGEIAELPPSGRWMIGSSTRSCRVRQSARTSDRRLWLPRPGCMNWTRCADTGQCSSSRAIRSCLAEPAESKASAS